MLELIENQHANNFVVSWEFQKMRSLYLGAERLIFVRAVIISLPLRDRFPRVDRILRFILSGLVVGLAGLIRFIITFKSIWKIRQPEIEELPVEITPELKREVVREHVPVMPVPEPIARAVATLPAAVEEAA